MLIRNRNHVPLKRFVYQSNFEIKLHEWIVNKLTSSDVQFILSGQGYCVGGELEFSDGNDYILWGTSIVSRPFRSWIGRQDLKSLQVRAVCGPTSRYMLQLANVPCPEIFGTPTLLLPQLYQPNIVCKTHEVGIIISQNDKIDYSTLSQSSVQKFIVLDNSPIESILADILSCNTIVSSTLEGLMIADAYDIGSAWILTKNPTHRTQHFHDYFLGVNKVRPPIEFDLKTSPSTLANIKMDGRRIDFSAEEFLHACPFLPGRVVQPTISRQPITNNSPLVTRLKSSLVGMLSSKSDTNQ